MLLASGGALDDWSFVVDTLIAIGTIGAVGVALWLGFSARSQEAKRELERAEIAARQVIVVFRLDGDQALSGPLIEIVNGSPEVVNELWPLVLDYLDDDGVTKHEWEWRGESDVPYLLSGQRAQLPGQFTHDGKGLPVTKIRPRRVRMRITWIDSKGQVWARDEDGTVRRCLGRRWAADHG